MLPNEDGNRNYSSLRTSVLSCPPVYNNVIFLFPPHHCSALVSLPSSSSPTSSRSDVSSPTCWLTGLVASPLFSPTSLEFWSRFNQEEEEEGGKNMAVSRMQIVVSSCVEFFSYVIKRVSATLCYGWIYFSSLSLLPFLCLSLFLLVSHLLWRPLPPSLFCFLSLFSV